MSGLNTRHSITINLIKKLSEKLKPKVNESRYIFMYFICKWVMLLKETKYTIFPVLYG